mgnify:CR=1 FL=1
MKTALFAAAAAFALSTAAHASVIPVLDSVTADGSDYLYSYTGQLAADQGVTAGDQLAIIDFQGYVDGSVSSSLPYVTASVVDTLPSGLLAPPGTVDNPLIPDLLFTYNGPDYQTTGGPYSAITYFSGLSAESTFGTTKLGYFSAEAVKNDGVEAGTAAYNVGSVGVPTAVPEPATWAMMLFGFFGIGAVARRRQAKTVMA